MDNYFQAIILAYNIQNSLNGSTEASAAQTALRLVMLNIAEAATQNTLNAEDAFQQLVTSFDAIEESGEHSAMTLVQDYTHIPQMFEQIIGQPVEMGNLEILFMLAPVQLVGHVELDDAAQTQILQHLIVAGSEPQPHEESLLDNNSQTIPDELPGDGEVDESSYTEGPNPFG